MIEWAEVEHCPICENRTSDIISKEIYNSSYYFGTREIGFDRGSIRIVKCHLCSIFYKTRVPSQLSLSDLFLDQLGDVWIEQYNFKAESDLVRGLLGDDFDLLDIGASNGAFLKACGGHGRRSALDVQKDLNLQAVAGSEFIAAFIDEDIHEWSKDKYDVITAFDVFEHLYDPNKAFKNIELLLKPGGYLIIETGNANCLSASLMGVENWWYANLVEHHIFWTPESLEKVAIKYGFNVVAAYKKRHKSIGSSWKIKHLKNFLIWIRYVVKAIARSIAPNYLKMPPQPWMFLGHDHFQIVLRKMAPERVE